MSQMDEDWAIRLASFRFLDELTYLHGDALPWSALQKGFAFNGRQVTLIGARGIWRAKGLSLPISITTSPNDPYGDEAGEDGLLRYRYYGTDKAHADNVGLRQLVAEARPLIYFRGIEKGWYAALWPMVLVTDNPDELTFVGACEDVESLVPGIAPSIADEARRRYVTRRAMVRLHQAGFRQRVLRAYERRCTVCRLRHSELLDAAHILPDRHEQGQPVVSNGLAMCKIHHAAFDANILGVRPDHVVEIRHDILKEKDGPMLEYGLQAVHASVIHLPRRTIDRPDSERLELRYDAFRSAG